MNKPPVEEPKVVPLHPDLDFIIEESPNGRHLKRRTDGRAGYTIGDEAILYQALVKTIARIKELEAATPPAAPQPSVSGKGKKS